MKIDSERVSVSIIDESLKDEVLRAEPGPGVNLEIALFCLPEILDHPDCGRYRDAVARIFSRPNFRGSLHGPFFEMAYHSRDPEVVKVVERRMRQSIGIAGDVGALFLVAHSTYNPLERRPGYEEKWLDRSRAFWERMVREAESRKVTIVLENIFDDRPDMQKALVRKIDSPRFRACVDTGHVQIWGKCPQPEWVRVLSKDLAYMHIDNNHGGWDEHLAVNDGVVNVEEVLRACEEHAAQPQYVIEVRRREAADASLAYLRERGWL